MRSAIGSGIVVGMDAGLIVIAIPAVLFGCWLAWGWFVNGKKKASMKQQQDELEREEREDHGVIVTVPIASIERTGTKINDQPEVSLVVHLELEDGRTHTIKPRTVLDPVVALKFQPGASLTVCYVPSNPDNHRILSPEGVYPANTWNKLL